VWEVEHDGKNVRSNETPNKHPSAEAMTELLVEAKTVEPMLYKREPNPGSDRYCHSKRVNGQWTYAPDRLLEVGKYLIAPLGRVATTSRSES
jgi:hypothetical protein